MDHPIFWDGKIPPKRRKKHRKKGMSLKTRILAFSLLFAALTVGIVILAVTYSGRVYSRAEVEAGDVKLSAQSFARGGVVVTFEEGYSPDEIDFHVPGEYEVRLCSGVFHYTSILTVRDTVPPKGEPVSQVISLGQEIEADAFVTSLRDETQTTVSYETFPDFTRIGTSEVRIILRDRGDNTTHLAATLTVIPLKTELVWEAGTPAPRPEDFILPGANVKNLVLSSSEHTDENGNPVLYTDLPGEYKVVFSADGLLCDCVLRVTDTVAPALVLHDLTAGVGQIPDAQEFVTSAEDVSPLTFSVSFEAGFDQPGVQTVTVRAEDTSGNFTERKARLYLVRDTMPPTIVGARDLTVYLGKTVNYLSGVRVEDDLDPKAALSVDTSKVDLKTEGSYPVTYTARDAGGNESRVKVTLNVIREVYDEETVMGLAKQVVDGILTASMTPRQKLDAIYTWVRKYVDYRECPLMNDWLKAANQGLVNHWGDCYVFQMTTRALLEAAGIENRLIDTLPNYNLHCWNLVNIGEGWYHFDTTKFQDGKSFCYLTTTELKNRSGLYPRSHNFDPALYPDVVE